MEEAIVEIPSTVPLSSDPPNQKEAYVYEVIDLDRDEDNADPTLPSNIMKGKAVMNESDGDSNGCCEESLDEYICISDLNGSINGTKSNGLEKSSHTSFDGDGQSYDVDPYDSDCMEEDAVDQHDDYDLLQAHFDSMNIAPGVEACVPWFPGTYKNEKKSDAGNNWHQSGSPPAESVGFLKETVSFGLNEYDPVEKNTISSISGSNGHANSESHPQVDQRSPWLSLQSMQSKKNESRSQLKGSNTNFFVGLEPSKISMFPGTHKNMKSPVSSSNITKFNSSSQLVDDYIPFGFKCYPSKLHVPKKQDFSNFSYQISPPIVSGFHSLPPLDPRLKLPSMGSIPPPVTFSSSIEPFSSSVYTLPEEDGDSQLIQNSSTGHPYGTEDVLRRFEGFKQFDTVQDHSDHQYIKYESAAMQPSKTLAKRIQEEWKILENNLPDNIFVRVYETRIDLLRAVIVGAEGTPYHDGLYFFDMFFPIDYPQNPPHVYYHSRGLRLNPNLYSNGKVCLSLLNTWEGEVSEKWIPGVSTVLQVLVSIQGLILNASPYFNEPGYEHREGTAHGEELSLKYNEDIFVLSLKTMTYVINKPPKHFEDFVMGHFFKRAEDILTACKAYIKGARVGSLVKGGEQNANAGGEGYQPGRFEKILASYIRILARAFMKIGVKDCEELLTYSLPPPTAAQETERQAEGITNSNQVSLPS
ncbi:hypothetical protein SAY87_004135 [Trapa incisa]|uniref:E2 ubiquitin-conjugating enzyme n=1 Tax=Trapa incisa TaxID=236973 RepID=A0AAN7JQR5_9MYRT|nr:hypothetical protein SAY87_004135 [Trapa incisa]